MTTGNLIPGRPETLALISFRGDGVVVSHTAVPERLVESRLKEVVKVFIASQSVVKALLGRSEQVKEVKKFCVSDISTAASNVFQVKLGNQAKFWALKLPDVGGMWVGLLASSLVLHDKRVLDALLPSIFAAADILGIGSCDLNDKVHGLLENMWKLTRSKSGRDERSVLHIKRSLIALSESQLYKDVSTSEQRSLPKFAVKEALNALRRFQSNISAFSGELSCDCTIISSNLLIVHIDEIPLQQSEYVLWYYTYVFEASPKWSQSADAEHLESGGIRLWYKWKGWVLCAQFICQEPISKRCFGLLHTDAQLILRVLSQNSKLLPPATLK